MVEKILQSGGTPRFALFKDIEHLEAIMVSKLQVHRSRFFDEFLKLTYYSDIIPPFLELDLSTIFIETFFNSFFNSFFNKKT